MRKKGEGVSVLFLGSSVGHHVVIHWDAGLWFVFLSPNLCYSLL